MNKKILVLFALLSMLALLVPVTFATSPIVQQVTGGGWFVNPCSESKCTFGFNAEENPAGNLKGNVEFVDHGTGYPHVHGYDIITLVVTETEAKIEGVCRLNGKPETYNFRVYVEDNGEPGTYDHFRIELYQLGFVGLFYEAEGELGFPDNGGGNIQIHVYP